jgi:hypothetical protein
MLLTYVLLRILKEATGKGTFIFSVSQAVIKALDNCNINSKLVWTAINP